jgi:hypothetical protein
MGTEELACEGYVQTLIMFWILTSSVIDIGMINTSKSGRTTKTFCNPIE